VKECVAYEANLAIKARLKNKNQLYWDLLLKKDDILLRSFQTQMQLDLKLLNLKARGEKIPEYFVHGSVAYENRVDKAMREHINEISEMEYLRNTYADELWKLYLERNQGIADDLTLSKEVTDTYNFNITTAAVWWNCDTPIPFGKAIVNFSTEMLDTNAGSELFIFNPRKQTINYRTKKQNKRVVADENYELYYIAFDLDGDNSHMAFGKKMIKASSKITLNYKKIVAADIEKAFAEMDAFMKYNS